VLPLSKVIVTIYSCDYVSNTIIDCNISRTVLYPDRNYIELLLLRELRK